MARATVDEVRAGLELALEEILNVQNMNIWYVIQSNTLRSNIIKYNKQNRKRYVRIGKENRRSSEA